MTSTLEQPQRVAIVKPCCIGDCIMALPAIDAITSEWTEASIDVFVGQHSRVAFAFRPALTTRPIPDALNLEAAMQLSRRLRAGSYDAVINLDRSRWLRLASHLSRASVTASARSVSPELRHESDVYLDVVREIGISTPASTPWVVPSPDAKRLAGELLKEVTSPVAVLHPGGAQNPGVNMLNKRWPAARFIQLARILKRDSVEVLLSGGPGDVEVARFVAEGAGLPDTRILAGKVDIETLAALIDRAAVYVGPDTGVSHIAAAVGVPTIVIFGPTNPRRYRPLGRDVHVLAPSESWQIPDRDLRRMRSPDQSLSTERVTLDAVVSSTRIALSREIGVDRCSE